LIKKSPMWKMKNDMVVIYFLDEPAAIVLKGNTAAL